MITLKLQFDYEGKTHKLQANLKNDMTISETKGNQATDIVEDFGEDERWSLIFGEHDLGYIEVVMYRDSETKEMLPEADYIIIWNGDTIEAEINKFYQQRKYK